MAEDRGRTPLRIVAVLAASLAVTGLTSACQPGTGGTLAPAPGQVVGRLDRSGRPTVVIGRSGVEVEVSGSWSTRRGVSTVHLDVGYLNRNPTDVTVVLSELTAVRGDDVGVATGMIDVTGVDLADDRTDNDDARILFEGYRERRWTTLTIPAGRRKLIDVTITLPQETAPIDDGQGVVVRTPMSGGVDATRFRTTSTGF